MNKILLIFSLILNLILTFIVVNCKVKYKRYLYQPFEEKSVKEKVDIVITWVNSSDIKWQKDKEYYYKLNNNLGDNDGLRFPDKKYSELELKTAILFILKNISWKGNIYIVTTDGQVPDCYYNLVGMYNNIKIVYHSDIWPKNLLNTLPTFNSHAIECNIHRIKGLSNNFIYFNDDMYLVKELDYNSMFYNNKMVIQPLESIVPIFNKKVWHQVWTKMYNLYDMHSPRHVCYALNKNVMNVAEDSVFDLWQKTISTRFRSTSDIAPVGYTINFCLQHKLGYLANKKLNLYAHHNPKKVFNVKDNKVDIVCINETSDIYKSINNLINNYEI